MPKRSVYPQPSDYLYRRTRRDLEFLCDYWDRLLTPNQSYDIRLPDLLRANHLMRHLSSLSLPSNQRLRVNVSFTILDGTRWQPRETYQRSNALPSYTESRNGFRRPPCNSNAVRCNDLLRYYIRQINENYAAIEKELLRARILAPLAERNIIAGCQNAFHNQRAATCNWNKFPAGSQAYSARNDPSLGHERHVKPRERIDQTCALFGHESCIADRKNKDGCSINQQSAKENSPRKFNDSPRTTKQHFPQTSGFCSPTVKKLQPNNNGRAPYQSVFPTRIARELHISAPYIAREPTQASTYFYDFYELKALQNCAGTALARNDNGAMKRRSSKESMEACQDVSKIVSSAAKIFHPAESRLVKPDDDVGVAINNSDRRSIEPQPASCQGNVLLPTAESGVVTDQNGRVAGQGRGGKGKLDDPEDRAIAVQLDLETGGQQDRPRTAERIEPRVIDAPAMFTPDEKATRSRIRNGRMPMTGKPFWKKHVSTPKYASFLRMFRKEETDDRPRDNSALRNEGTKSQRRTGVSAGSSSDERDNRANPRTGRRTPTPRSTVHTTYNPVTHSSATEPILDSSGLTIQLLRLAVLLYAPTLMSALNSLIAQQNQQTPTSSTFDCSNDLLMQIFRLLNEQRSIPNLPLVSLGSERAPSALTAETNGESSRSLSEEREDNASAVLTKSDPVSEQGSISGGKSRWKSHEHVPRQNGRNGRWRLTSMLTNSDVRLDGNIFTAKDLRKFEQFLKVERKRPEDVRSLSTRSKNELVMKEYFRNWLHRLLRHLNSASGNLSGEERECPEGSSRTAGSSLEEVEGRRNGDRSVADEPPDCSRDDGNTFSEREEEEEEEDSDDQKSFTSATSTNSSRSHLKQDGAIVAENEEKLPRDQQD